MTTLLVRNIHTLATMDAVRREFRDAAIYVRDNAIVAVGSLADMPATTADQVIDGRRHVVLPGLGRKDEIGLISETAETNVVFPTPNPPATTSLTDETLRARGAIWSSAARSGRVAEVDQAPRPSADSKGPDTFDHPRDGRELDLDGVGRFEAAVVDQIADDHHRDPERDADAGRDLRDRGRLVALVDDAGLLEIEVVARSTDRLDHRLHAERCVGGARPAARDHERSYEVVGRSPGRKLVCH
jgi:hypothetical protein